MLKYKVLVDNVKRRFFMKRILLISIGMILILFSSPLGRFTITTIYFHTNLASEYETLLRGSINSYIIVGVLFYILGLTFKKYEWGERK